MQTTDALLSQTTQCPPTKTGVVITPILMATYQYPLFPQAPVMEDHPRTLHSLGGGICGLVLGWFDMNEVVEHGNHSPILSAKKKLWNDFVQHRAVNEALKLLGQTSFKTLDLVSVDVPHSHWATSPDRRAILEGGWASISLEVPSAGPPVDIKTHSASIRFFREVLVKKYCPDVLREAARNVFTNVDAIVKLYLGKCRGDCLAIPYETVPKIIHNMYVISFTL